MEEYNSRIETPLWRLQRGSDRAEARMRVKFSRREFRVYINGELLWSRNFGLDDTAQFDAAATAKFEELTGLGWGPPDGAAGATGEAPEPGAS